MYVSMYHARNDFRDFAFCDVNLCLYVLTSYAYVCMYLCILHVIYIRDTDPGNANLICMYTRVCVCMYVCTYLCIMQEIYIRDTAPGNAILICMYTHVCLYACMYVCIYVFTYLS